MANNVYIGNRYVPIFADPVEWNKLKTYEALTIVTYQGTSYTSKKAVPAGIELSNNDYWVVTGNYNEQVEAYRKDITKYKQDTNEKINKVNTDLTNRINTLHPNKYRVVFVGDDFANLTLGVSAQWMDYAKTLLGLSESDYYKTAQTGVGYTTTKNFTDLLNDLSVSSADTITHVVINGGMNDVGETQNNINKGVDKFMQACQTKFKNAKVCVLMAEKLYSKNLQEEINTQKYIFRAFLKYQNTSFDSDGIARIWDRQLINTEGTTLTNLGAEEVGVSVATLVRGIYNIPERILIGNKVHFTSLGGGTFDYNYCYLHRSESGGMVDYHINFAMSELSLLLTKGTVTNILKAPGLFNFRENEALRRYEYQFFINTNYDKPLNVAVELNGDTLAIRNLDETITITDIRDTSATGGIHFIVPAIFT